MMRPNTCASGRNSRVEASGSSNTSGVAATMFAASKVKLPWVSSQPFGRPVVPEV